MYICIHPPNHKRDQKALAHICEILMQERKKKIKFIHQKSIGHS